MSYKSRTLFYSLLAAVLLVACAFCMGIVASVHLTSSQSNITWAMWSIAGGAAILLLVCMVVVHHRMNFGAKTQSQLGSEELRMLAMVAERTTNGVSITNKEDKLLWVNKSFSRISGYSLEEVLGGDPAEILHCENTNQATVLQIQSAIRNGHGFHGEILNRDKYGREYWIDLEIQAIRNENYEITGYMGIQSDITERFEAERSARELAKVVNEAPHEFYIFDAKTLEFVVVNDGACEALGYRREELLSMTPLDIKPEFDEERFRREIAPLTSKHSGESSLFFDTLHQRKDGSTYSTQVSLHATEFGGRTVYAAFVTDLTERQKLEQQLVESRKLESIGQLAAGIAHEINTPMQCVVSNLEYLEQTIAQLLDVTDGYHNALELPAEAWDSRKQKLQELEAKHHYTDLRSNSVEAIEESVESTKRVVEVVRAMKTMSHPGAAEKVWLDVNEMVRNAVTISRSSWKYHATLDLKLDDSIPSIPMLSNQMSQVLINLLVNASDAIAEKFAEQENPELGEIQVATWQESNGVKIRIRDTGCGMTNEQQQRALDPFFTTKEVGKGTGQGLAISHDIVVSKHQGTIEFESELGVGTTFTIWLPGDIVIDSPDEIEEVEPENRLDLSELQKRFAEYSASLSSGI